MSMKREEFQKMLESDEKLLKRFQEDPIAVCSEHGIELTEEELEQISGGWGGHAESDGTNTKVGFNSNSMGPDKPGKDLDRKKGPQ